MPTPAWEQEYLRRLKKAGAHVANTIREKISTPYPPASDPGHPPHLRTGTLWSEVGFEIQGRECIISVTAPYASYLEYGTRFMAPRPYVRSTILEETQTIQNILRGG